jgi:hypothetical protein
LSRQNRYEHTERQATKQCSTKTNTCRVQYLGWPSYDLLDIKLALYSLIPARMPHGGVFLCSSDTIELFDESNRPIDWSLTDDFVALAHRSSVMIGTQHGVYVMDANDKQQCQCVLQKPTIEQMRMHHAIQCDRDIDDEEFVYTDSLYYFNMNVAQRLADIYREQETIPCEIDCYGDFMRPLGRCPLPRPVAIDGNIESIQLKQTIYDRLRDCRLQVIILNKSSFNHTGTNDEYLDICCAIGSTGANIFQQLKLDKHIACRVFDEDRHENIDFWHG